MHRDTIQIKILAFSYFIFAGGIAYIACLPAPFLGSWNAVFLPAIRSGEPMSTTPMNLIAVFGLVFGFLVVPISVLVLGGLLVFNITKLGYFLLKKQGYSFCIKMVGISILLIPIGTLLGILTHSVLTRSSVKELFNYSDNTVQS